MDVRQKYQEIADLTQPICAKICRLPQQCCAAEHCYVTKQFAKEEHGIDLPETGHPKLPFMGDAGCTVAPYLRPMCSVHVCEMSLVKAGWDKFEKYNQLRHEISEELFNADKRQN